MEPQLFTVIRINGEYAELVSDSGIENMVALALLPDETEAGARLQWDNFQFTLL